MIQKSFTEYSKFKNKFTTRSREPFFAIAIKYCRMIKKENPVIVDIGAGEGDFYSYAVKNQFPVLNLFLLDSNIDSIENNKKYFTSKSLHYLAPERLPFEDSSVDIIHTSHLIEYLNPTELYSLMKECNRVLISGGYIIISAPLLWDDFYEDLGHLRPYNPIVFQKYFSSLYRNNRLGKISDSYVRQELVYRYCQMPLDEGWSSSIPFIDFVLTFFKRVLGKMGFRKLHKNGYTLVLEKNN